VVAFNETFALVGKHSKVNRKHLAVAWHVATAGRNAEEIAAAYAKALKHDRGRKHWLVQLKTRIGAYLYCWRVW